MAGSRLVGTGYAVKREKDSWVEIGLWVRRQYEGQGVGTYMLSKLRDHALENLECDGVYLVHEASNGAMAHMASKLGFEISEVNQRSGSGEIDKRLIAQDVISGFNVMRILHNPKANTGVLTKYGKKWADYRDRPLSQKIQIIPY
jgi:RimJ/RimL family protein N-acetyltransferase